MKHILRLLIFIAFVLPGFSAQSQVTLLSDNTNIRSGIALGNIGVLADANGVLWVTDGTAAGTMNYTIKVLIDTSINTAILNNKIYFNGATATTGRELWVTDGTDGGTLLVKDINAGAANSAPRDLFIFNNTLYFFANSAQGIELWKSDGTDAGTLIVKDIYPGIGSSYDNGYTSFFASNNILYFNANNGTNGTELWKTDGTDAGTVMVKDIYPGPDSSKCENFTTVGTSVLFSADDGTSGVELYKSNGTLAGTVLVEDIVSGAASSSPQQFVPFLNNVLFLVVINGFPFPTYQLYWTDGNTAMLVKDFGLGGLAIISNSVIINNKLYFTAYSPSTGAELWYSDGTDPGTRIFKDINSGGGSSTALILPDYFSLINGNTDIHTKLFNGKIFFMADDGTNGFELWITDGTTANTKMVKNLNPGSAPSLGEGSASWFYTANKFYFVANDGTAGNELFSTDGIEANTALVKDINPGSASSDPFLFMYVNKHIYFTADDGNNANADKDLYIIDEEVVLPVTLVDFTAMLSGKAVDLKWVTATETNTKNFEVQRSIDGIHFKGIGTVNAAGNSLTRKDYSFIDAGALSAGSKTIYYRLQMMDNDGKFSNSKIIKIEITPGGNAIAVYPNPVRDKLIIVTNSSLSNALIKITDQSGKIVLLQKAATIQAGEKNTIDVSRLGKGVYNLQLISDNDKQSSRFIKF